MCLIERMLKQILSKSVIALSCLLVTSAFANDATSSLSVAPSTVVELFTSQGCSSCPPANKFVGELSDDQNVLVLSYGVTYWDYLGWKDTFGDAKFTSRQRAYGKAFDLNNVYTPQIVLNGSAHSPRYAIEDIKTMAIPQVGELQLSHADDSLVLEGESELTVLVSYVPGWQAVDVGKGENRGQTLRLANVVTDIKAVEPGVLNITPEKGLAYAVLSHDPNTKKVLSAAVFTP